MLKRIRTFPCDRVRKTISPPLLSFAPWISLSIRLRSLSIHELDEVLRVQLALPVAEEGRDAAIDYHYLKLGIQYENEIVCAVHEFEKDGGIQGVGVHLKRPHLCGE